jgi:acetyltransferase-like isoleucine patch superfamily enzyme
MIRRRPGVSCAPTAFVKGWPTIRSVNNGKIIIGDGVTLNSDNRKYHGNLYQRVKLVADGSTAILKIGENTRIHGSCLHARRRISIGRNCLIAGNCQILDSSGHDVFLDDPSDRIRSTGKSNEVIIEDNVWIGMNSLILPGAHIKAGAVIGAGSIVRGTVPAGVLFVSPDGLVVSRSKS